MTLPEEVDPAISEHIVAIRNRFGVDGMRKAAQILAIEIAIFEDSYEELPK